MSQNLPDYKSLPGWGTPGAVFGWYDFRPGAIILENPDAAASGVKYDYILCIDREKLSAEIFTELAEKLNPDGRLLLAVENKYGIKYWCGTCGGEFGESFGELERGNTLLSGAELQRALNNSGFTAQKWFYPIPGHQFPLAVFSDNKLPNRFFATISPAKQYSGAGTLLREAKLLPGIIEGGAFTFMSNSFIVEAAREPNAIMCPVDFAAITQSRPPDRAFITTVRADGTARKTALYPEGHKSLQVLTENHTRLISRGIEAVALTLDAGCVQMPAIEHETLWEYMQGLARDGCYERDVFIELFDRLRDDILRSSEQSPPGSHGWDASFGPVLEYAYTEMVPANCFYDKEHNAFIYFDQEHVRRNYPYSVPLSRALMSITYSPELSAHTGAMELLPELISRYGLVQCWDALVKIEEEFIAGLINGTETAQAYDRKAAEANAEIIRNRRIHNAITAVANLVKHYKTVGIYGFGERGKFLAAALRLLGCSPAFTADRKTGGLPKNVKADIIVVTPKDGADEIVSGLKKLTDIPITTMDAIFE